MLFSMPSFTLALALFSAIMTTGQARASGAGTGAEKLNVSSDMRFNWKPDARTASFQFSTGCRSTSAGPLQSDFRVRLQHGSKRFIVSGGFFMRKPVRQFRIGTADCMGSRTEHIRIDFVQADTYEIIRNGRTLWRLKLGNAPLSRVKPRPNMRRVPPPAYRSGRQHIGKARMKGKAVKVKATYPRRMTRRAGLGLVWSARNGLLRVVLSTGCLPSSARNLHDDFAFKLDHAARTLHIGGDYRYIQRTRISTRDCMNTTSQAYDFNELAPGVYRVLRHGRQIYRLNLGTKDLRIGTHGKGRIRLMPLPQADSAPPVSPAISLQLAI